jgi:hypothetical protein
MTHPIGVPLFVRFFRAAAGIDIDKNDVRRFREFVDDMVAGMAVAGRNAARSNGRDVIAPQDLPITKGLQERMREFDKLDEASEIRELLAQNLRRPPENVTFSDETERQLPEVFGGLSVALARSLRVLAPNLRRPTPEHWDQVYEAFRLVF